MDPSNVCLGTYYSIRDQTQLVSLCSVALEMPLWLNTKSQRCFFLPRLKALNTFDSFQSPVFSLGVFKRA